jgi:hypothetical protein
MDTFGNQTDPHFSCLHIFLFAGFSGSSLQAQPSPLGACPFLSKKKKNRHRENEHKGPGWFTSFG